MSCSACPAIAPNDTPAVAIGAAAPAAALPNPVIVLARDPSPPAMVLMPPITFPPITRRGPTTAAIPATFMIVSCISGDKLFHASDAADIPSDTDPRMSTNAGPADSTMSAPRIFSSFIVVVKSSIGLSVPSNASDTLPPASRAALPSSEKSSVPFWIAP